MCIRDSKVAVEGRSMVNVITTAAELGYLRIPDQTLIEIDQVKNYPCLLYTSYWEQTLIHVQFLQLQRIKKQTRSWMKLLIW